MSSVSALGGSLIRPVSASRAAHKARQDNLSDNAEDFERDEAGAEEENNQPEPKHAPISVSAAPYGDIAKTRMTAGAETEHGPPTEQLRLKCATHRLKDAAETEPSPSKVLNRRL